MGTRLDARRDAGAGQAAARLTRAAAVAARPLAVYAASRVVVLVAVAVGAALGGLSFLEALTAWDGRHYLTLAAEGYPRSVPIRPGDVTSNAMAFFPVYPLAFIAVSTVTGLSPAVAAPLLAGVCGAVAAVALWRLVERLAGADVADRSVVLLSFFPGSFVLTMAYAESLLLALAVGCLLLLLDRRWLAAGAVAAVATATRPNAVALCACCLWAAVAACRSHGDLRPLLAPALSPLGLVAFFGYLWARTGVADAWLAVQRVGWGERVDFGARTLREVALVVGDPAGDVHVTASVAGLAVAGVGAWLLWRWRPPTELLVYTAAVLALALLSSGMQARPRFVLTAFPLIVALARSLHGVAYTAAVGVSGALLAAVTVLSVSQRLFLVP